MHDPFDRAERMVADRIVAFFRMRNRAPVLGDELPRIGSCRVVGSIKSATAGVMATA